MENRGISPDIEVEMDPKLVREGHDPQLEKAVDVVMQELRNIRCRLTRSRHTRITSRGLPCNVGASGIRPRSIPPNPFCMARNFEAIS